MEIRRRQSRMRYRLSSVVGATLLLACLSAVNASPVLSGRDMSDQGLPADKVTAIKAILNETATKSWEIGTHMQTLLEYDYPTLTPFDAGSMPPPSSPLAHPVIWLAQSIVANKSDGSLQLMPDGSAADPASTGGGVILANLTAPAGQEVSNAQLAAAAEEQLDALLLHTPRTNDGAISHRTNQVELWSDFIYMAPPFIAYFGATTSNATLLQLAYDQCRLYRQYLRQANGLWAHILMGSHADPGLWATGNGWAAAGMLRVAVTLARSSLASDYSAQIGDLLGWTNEIVTAAFAQQQSSGLFKNYFGESTFEDAASAAILASASYRLAYLGVNNSTIPAAEKTRQVVYNSLNATGVLQPVVDPLSFQSKGDLSPEGQAFVLLMEAAWRDWYTQKTGHSPEVGQATPATTTRSAAAGTLNASWTMLAVFAALCASLYL